MNDAGLYLPSIVGLLIAAYWAVLRWRYPDRWPPGFETLPFERTPERWRLVAAVGIVAGLVTAAMTYLILLS